MISNKKDFLKFIKGAGVGLYGAPAAQSTVKFQFATSIATAATSETAGALTFAADANGNAAIFAQGALVSSKIQNVAAAAASGAKHGGKTVTISYVRMDEGHKGEIGTSTFDVIDEAALEAYFANSKTITLDTSTFEVKIKADGGLAVDNNDGLYVDIQDLFGVDGETIDFDDQNKLKTIVKLAYAQSGQAGEPAIQLQNANDEALSEVTVSDLIADGIVESTSYDAATNILTINWKGGAVTTINMAAIIDINDVFITADSSNLLTAANDTSVVKIGTTAKLRNAVALAESALQGISEGSSTENYVILDVAAGTDPSTKVISIDDSALNTKINAIDQKDSDQDASIDALQAYDIVIDASIDRLDTSVSAIETAIAAMNADLSVNALDGSIGITLAETDGKVTSIGITATEATTTFTAAVGETPASLVSTEGILTGAAIEDIVDYVNAKSGALDSSVTGKDVAEFVTVNTVQTDGALSAENVTVVYGNYDKNSQTNGIATTAATKTYVDTEITAAIEDLDLANDVADSSAHDSKNYVKTVISETDGIVKNESVTVTYGDYSTYTAGVATVEDTSVFVQNQITTALTWQILS